MSIMVSDGISQVVYSRTGTGSSSAIGFLNSTAAKRRKARRALSTLLIASTKPAPGPASRCRPVRSPSTTAMSSGFAIPVAATSSKAQSAISRRRRHRKLPGDALRGRRRSLGYRVQTPIRRPVAGESFRQRGVAHGLAPVCLRNDRSTRATPGTNSIDHPTRQQRRRHGAHVISTEHSNGELP